MPQDIGFNFTCEHSAENSTSEASNRPGIPESDMAPVLASVKQAVKAGCKVVCVTVGTPYQPTRADGGPNPAKLRAVGNPFHELRCGGPDSSSGRHGCYSEGHHKCAGSADRAIEKGVQGVIVSNHGGVIC